MSCQWGLTLPSTFSQPPYNPAVSVALLWESFRTPSLTPSLGLGSSFTLSRPGTLLAFLSVLPVLPVSECGHGVCALMDCHQGSLEGVAISLHPVSLRKIETWSSGCGHGSH